MLRPVGIRLLPPPRIPARTECSGDSSNSPPIGGSRARIWSLEQGNWFWQTFSPLLSLASADPFLAWHPQMTQAGRIN